MNYEEIMKAAENAMTKLFDPENQDNIWLKLYSDGQLIVYVDEEPLFKILSPEDQENIKQATANAPGIQ